MNIVISAYDIIVNTCAIPDNNIPNGIQDYHWYKENKNLRKLSYGPYALLSGSGFVLLILISFNMDIEVSF